MFETILCPRPRGERKRKKNAVVRELYTQNLNDYNRLPEEHELVSLISGSQGASRDRSDHGDTIPAAEIVTVHRRIFLGEGKKKL